MHYCYLFSGLGVGSYHHGTNVTTSKGRHHDWFKKVYSTQNQAGNFDNPTNETIVNVNNIGIRNSPSRRIPTTIVLLKCFFAE